VRVADARTGAGPATVAEEGAAGTVARVSFPLADEQPVSPAARVSRAAAGPRESTGEVTTRPRRTPRR
jgi:hypothetical protein